MKFLLQTFMLHKTDITVGLMFLFSTEEGNCAIIVNSITLAQKHTYWPITITVVVLLNCHATDHISTPFF